MQGELWASKIVYAVRRVTCELADYGIRHQDNTTRHPVVLLTDREVTNRHQQPVAYQQVWNYHKHGIIAKLGKNFPIVGVSSLSQNMDFEFC